jgi:hypothetical protein
MTEVINLKQKRKAKTRVEKEKQASENRLKFGRTKGEKQLEKLVADKAVRHIEGHKRETDDTV